jgi:hypothetical protein
MYRVEKVEMLSKPSYYLLVCLIVSVIILYSTLLVLRSTELLLRSTSKYFEVLRKVFRSTVVLR